MLENINRARGALRGGHTAEGAPSAFLRPKAEEGRLRHRACGKGGMRHMKTAWGKKAVCAALALFAALVWLPAAAFAESVQYLGEDGKTYTQENATPVSQSDTEWGKAGGETWYVAKDTVEITGRVKVTGSVHLILANGANLTVNGGIEVSEGNSFTVYAQSTKESEMGSLTATAVVGTGNAGIGGNSGGSGGAITITGGVVTATGGGTNWGGAGIGGGEDGDGGTITIKGGKVTATGGGTGWSGAGIGGGNNGSGGTITITGGVVNATGGGGGGAGIGGGSLTISPAAGWSIEAKAGESAAAATALSGSPFAPGTQTDVIGLVQGQKYFASTAQKLPDEEKPAQDTGSTQATQATQATQTKQNPKTGV